MLFNDPRRQGSLDPERRACLVVTREYDLIYREALDKEFQDGGVKVRRLAIRAPRRFCKSVLLVTPTSRNPLPPAEGASLCN